MTRPSDGHQAREHSDEGYAGRQWGNSWQGRRGLKHGASGGWGRRSGPGSEGSGEVTRLVCTACDSNGYTPITRPNSTYGFCQCATGWGVEPADNNTDGGSQWWEGKGRGRHIRKCVDCSVEGKVPFTDKSNLRLSWDGANWGLVLASGASSASVGVQHAEGAGQPDPEDHWHGGWWAAGGRPPLQVGVCVSCPDGSAPSSDSSACGE